MLTPYLFFSCLSIYSDFLNKFIIDPDTYNSNAQSIVIILYFDDTCFEKVFEKVKKILHESRDPESITRWSKTTPGHRPRRTKV